MILFGTYVWRNILPNTCVLGLYQIYLIIEKWADFIALTLTIDTIFTGFTICGIIETLVESKKYGLFRLVVGVSYACHYCELCFSATTTWITSLTIWFYHNNVCSTLPGTHDSRSSWQRVNLWNCEPKYILP